MDLVDFQKEVLDRSFQLPILVDFWASWCQPCQFIGPILEKLAHEAEKQWHLVKVDTEESREVATAYKIMSIPAIKLFHKGEIIAEFNGALPEPQVKEWLKKHLPDERREELSKIIGLLTDPYTYQNALTTLKAFVHKNPTYLEAKVLLAKEIAILNPDHAQELIENITLGNPLYDDAQDIQHIIQFGDCITQADAPFKEKLIDAHQNLKERQYEKALARLIEALTIDKNFCDEIIRKVIIAIFHQLGEQHEITKKYRIKFSMALY